MEKEDFIKKHCKECDEKCEKGLYISRNFVKCGDTLISEREEEK